MSEAATPCLRALSAISTQAGYPAFPEGVAQIYEQGGPFVPGAEGRWLGSSASVDDYPSALDDTTQVPGRVGQHTDVRQWIAIEQEQVGSGARGDGPGLTDEVEQLGGDGRGGS